MMEYRKFCYWTDLHGLKLARRNVEKRGIELSDEARIPCRVLRASTEIACVAPLAWNGFCKRRTSWYRKSAKSDKFLIVSDHLLDYPGLGNPIILTESGFKPDRIPSPQEIPLLIQSEEYQKKKPREWDNRDPLEKDFYQRWFERNKINEPFDFDKILTSHSANHSNFLDPRFFINLNGSIVPYSISDSIHVCSSCLEFFNILGEQWRVKYVVPCIGAVQFAHLPMDRYFEVRTQPGENDNRES
ncbi:MAG TPA: hypothetical protein VLZ03_09445 [Thermodesulfobacteriota bacterium]|nr:hypothetical protein [Thermodesulfobacteriota bacterium]